MTICETVIVVWGEYVFTFKSLDILSTNDSVKRSKHCSKSNCHKLIERNQGHYNLFLHVLQLFQGMFKLFEYMLICIYHMPCTNIILSRP